MFWEDGKGSGFKAGVNSENRGLVHAVSVGELRHVAGEFARSYIWASGTYNYDAADTILLVKNIGVPLLHVDGVWLSVDTDTRVVIHLPTAEVTVAGVTVTGVNLNTSSGNVAEASAAQDETGNTQGGVIWSGEIHAAQAPVFIPFGGAVILAKNKSIGVDYVTVGTACDVVIIGHYGD